MKVIHVFPSLNFGGIETRALCIADNPSGSNVELIFCAIKDGGDVSKRILSVGGNVVVLKCSSRIPSLLAIIRLFVFFIKERPGVVHTHGAEANFHGIIAAWAAGVPVKIAEEIGIPSHSGIAKRVFSFVYKLSDHVIAISDAVKDWLVSSGEALPGKVARIYNPVSAPPESLIDRHVSSDPINTLNLAFVGRLEPVKNPLSLIEAVSLLLKKDIPVTLKIVGAGSQMEECLSLRDRLGLQNNVNLTGYSSSPFSIIKDCQLYVQPSLSEGFGIALVEAMLCQIPVLASSVGGAPEIINHDENGWLVDFTDPQSLCSAIEAIWFQRDKLNQVAKLAKESVQGRFEPSLYVKQLESLYVRVLSSGK